MATRRGPGHHILAASPSDEERTIEQWQPDTAHTASAHTTEFSDYQYSTLYSDNWVTILYLNFGFCIQVCILGSTVLNDYQLLRCVLRRLSAVNTSSGQQPTAYPYGPLDPQEGPREGRLPGKQAVGLIRRAVRQQNSCSCVLWKFIY